MGVVRMLFEALMVLIIIGVLLLNLAGGTGMSAIQGTQLNTAAMLIALLLILAAVNRVGEHLKNVLVDLEELRIQIRRRDSQDN